VDYIQLINILLETIEKHDILLELFMCNTYCTKYREIRRDQAMCLKLNYLDFLVPYIPTYTDYTCTGVR
jgi:hypothetical protein